MNSTEQYGRRFLISILILSLGAVFFILKDFFTPLFFAVLFSAVFYPFYQKNIERFKKRKKGLIFRLKKDFSAAIVIAVLIFIVIIPLFMTSILFINEAGEFYSQIKNNVGGKSEITGLISNAKKYQNLLSKYIPDYINFPDVETIINKQILPIANRITGYSLSWLAGVFGNSIKFLMNLAIMILGVFYILKYGEELGDFLIRLSPLKTKDEMKLFLTFKNIGKGVIIGNTVSAFSQGFLAGIGFLILGIPHSLFFGVMAIFFAFIPFLGPLVVCIPMVIYLFIISRYTSAIILLIYSIIVISSADNVIKPYFIGESAKVNPFLILLSVFGGLKLFGILGIFYGPLIITIFLTISEIYLLEIEGKNSEQRKK